MEPNKTPNYFTLLAGSSESMAINQPLKTLIKIANTPNRPLKIHGIVVRYKDTLETCGIKITSSSFSRGGNGGDVLVGNATLGVLGSPYGSTSYNVFPFPGKKRILNNSDNIEIQISTKSVAVTPNDISVIFLAEEVE